VLLSLDISARRPDFYSFSLFHSAHRDPGGKVTLAIFRCRKITIAAVNGHAAGVGITGLQLPSDFRFIWAGAKLAFPFIRRGIAPEGTLQLHACPPSSLASVGMAEHGPTKQGGLIGC
jgi:enoyl-CoA hydratase/carnithine racemase